MQRRWPPTSAGPREQTATSGIGRSTGRAELSGGRRVNINHECDHVNINAFDNLTFDL
jgi:hypothetical protein